MSVGIKKLWLALGISVLSVACVTSDDYHVTNALESTNRNELYAPGEYDMAVKSKEGYLKLYENNNFEYYYSSSKTILRIVNKKTGFVWSTGADTEKKSTQLSKCSGVSKYSDAYYACAIDVGPTGKGNDNENGYAEINGLMYFTYFNPKTSNSSETARVLTEKSTTALYGHSKLDNEWMFKMSYKSGDYEFAFNLRFTFTEDGFDLKMFESDIYGKSNDLVEAVYPLPRLGQSGGKMIQCRISDDDGNGIGDCHFDDLSTIIDNPKTNLDGYIFVPDGSGALIRFDNIKYYDTNGVYFDMYKDPYREKHTDLEFKYAIYTQEPDYVPTKHISMPVWGVAYGDNQDAFVAYVKEGSEYFGLLYKGRTKTYEYASIQPRFERNRSYQFQFGTGLPSAEILNEKEIYKYDISVSYNFLAGDGSDGSYPANYVGMALKYREYLETYNLVKQGVEIEVGPKVDFLICDVKEGLFGYSEVNVTTFNDIVNMLGDFNSQGIENVTSTLYGWQNGGISIAKPWTTNYNTKAGGKVGVKDVVSTASQYGYDVNFYQQYGLINEAQVASFNAYCVKALSRDYGAYVLSDVNKPITWWEYVNADVAGTWLNDQARKLSKLGDNVGITVGGLSTLLVPDYGKKLTYAGAANSAYHSTKEASNLLSIAGDTPNSYLWKNYDSFYNLSVYNSQLQCETDSVPFMEIVFSGLINMYAEYANFSFYDDISQLKMIDYNLNPSFIISKEENENIMYTNARDWFTTGYDSYSSIISEICNKVLPKLQLVKGKTMINREVIEFDDDSLGLYVNTYATVSKGKISNDKTVMAINYFDHDVTFTYNNKTYTVKALEATELK